MDLFDAMRRNPQDDWMIRDIESVCKAHNVACKPPKGGGSHFKISHPAVAEILTVPARRPIKPVYIRALVRYIDRVTASNTGAQ